MLILPDNYWELVRIWSLRNILHIWRSCANIVEMTLPCPQQSMPKFICDVEKVDTVIGEDVDGVLKF